MPLFQESPRIRSAMMNRLTKTLFGTALLVVLAASGARADGISRSYRDAGPGLRLDNSIGEYDQVSSDRLADLRFELAPVSGEQCVDGRCCSGLERCICGRCDGACVDGCSCSGLERCRAGRCAAGCKFFDGLQCSNPNCDDCQEAATYGEIVPENFDLSY